MTEPSSPFGGGTTVAPPPTTVEPPADLVLGNEDNRRKLIIVGAVVAVLLVVVAAYFLLLRHPAPAVPGGAVPKAATVHNPTANGSGQQKSGTKHVTLPKVGKHPVGHDPFKPLVSEPVVASTEGTKGSSKTPSTTSSTGSSTGTGTGTTTPGTTTPVPARIPVGIKLVHLNGARFATMRVYFNSGRSSKAYRVAAPPPVSSTHPSGVTTFAQHFGLYEIFDNNVRIDYVTPQGDHYMTLTLGKFTHLH